MGKDFKTRIIIAVKYRKIFKIFRQCRKLFFEMIRQKKITWDDKNNFSKVTIIIISKTKTTSEAIYVLCKKGFGKDAVILLRTILEMIANYRYISDNEKRADDFVNYEIHERIKMANALLELKTIEVDELEVQKNLRKLKLEWNKVKRIFEYQDKKGKTKVRDAWHGKTIQTICSNTGLSDHYNTLYRQSSLLTHPTPSSAWEYVLGIAPDGDVIAEVGASQQLIRETMVSITDYFLLLLGMLDEKYKMESAKKIEKLKKKLKNINSKFNSTHASPPPSPSEHSSTSNK